MPKKKSKQKWSQGVTDTSDAMDVEGGVFKQRSAMKIADSLKHSAEESPHRKATAFRSAISMLTFYIIAPVNSCPSPDFRGWSVPRTSYGTTLASSQSADERNAVIRRMIKPPNDNPRADDRECQQALQASFLAIIDQADAAAHLGVWCCNRWASWLTISRSSKHSSRRMPNYQLSAHLVPIQFASSG
jgi:hypothetical protein